MKDKKLKIIFGIMIIAILAFIVLAGENDPAEFGNTTETTVYVGGAAGQINATGSIKTDDRFIGQLVSENNDDLMLYSNGTCWFLNSSTVSQEWC